MGRRPQVFNRLHQRIARWAYRTGRFDLCMHLSPSVYWDEATGAAARIMLTDDDRTRELRGDD